MQLQLLSQKDLEALPRLSRSFFMQGDVVDRARALLGKTLVSLVDGELCAGRIVETEAYRGADDKASHAYGYKRTQRTRVAFLPGGHAYIYLCYGIHHLLNVVTGPEGEPDVVLLRGLQPLHNLPVMLSRRQMQQTSYRLSAGPGTLGQALGIHHRMSGIDMLSEDSPFYLLEDALSVDDDAIIAGPRVGIGYAEEAIHFPWRFSLRQNPWVSKAKGAS